MEKLGRYGVKLVTWGAQRIMVTFNGSDFRIARKLI